MPKPSKARDNALRREEARRLEREANLKSMLQQPAESPSVETHVPQPRGSSRTSKWRNDNGKTKRSRAVQMQPSVLKFFSVSTGYLLQQELRGTHPSLLADEQPIGAHKGIAAEDTNGGQGKDSVLEVSVRSRGSHAFANLTVRISEVSEVDVGETLAKGPGSERAVSEDTDSENTDSENKTVNGPNWLRGTRLMAHFVAQHGCWRQ